MIFGISDVTNTNTDVNTNNGEDAARQAKEVSMRGESILVSAPLAFLRENHRNALLLTRLSFLIWMPNWKRIVGTSLLQRSGHCLSWL